MKVSDSALPSPEDRRRRRRLKKVRQTCEALLDRWGMDHGCGIDELHRYLSAQNERPIHLIPMPFPERHLFGLWLKMDDFDIIAYEKAASASHKEHIIAHELAHIAFQHRGSVKFEESATGPLFSDVEPGVVKGMLMRSRYSDDEEQEAEMMASLILARATKRWLEPAWGVPAEAAEIVARIENGVGKPDHG